MTRALVGPWLKLYLDVVERKAHYNDRQFRALIEVYVLAARSPEWGVLPPRRALERLEGKATIGFLFEQGDLAETESNGVTTVTVVGWQTYQAKAVDSTNAERQARFRAHKKGSNGVTSSSSSSNGPRARGAIVDERELTDEQYRAAYIARQSQRTGVKT